MSILIKGMEMPKNCKDCPFSDHEAWCLIPGDWRERYYCPDDERSEYCPLIELPPHGRLIDADELIDGCEKLMRMLDPESKEYLRVFAIKCYLMWAAEYAVIEAEGSET